MNYLYLIGGEECSGFTGGIGTEGPWIRRIHLTPPQGATAVPVRKGKVLTTDGPFAETKEQLGGYHVIDGRDHVDRD
jgi:hypothetical protein